MVDLFNENTLFVFFFAMVAIYNYSALKEYQRMAIIYISVYALAALDIISIKLGLLFLIVALFCFFEIFTTDEMKFKILVSNFSIFFSWHLLSTCDVKSKITGSFEYTKFYF